MDMIRYKVQKLTRRSKKRDQMAGNKDAGDVGGSSEDSSTEDMSDEGWLEDAYDADESSDATSLGYD